MRDGDYINLSRFMLCFLCFFWLHSQSCATLLDSLNILTTNFSESRHWLFCLRVERASFKITQLPTRNDRFNNYPSKIVRSLHFTSKIFFSLPELFDGKTCFSTKKVKTSFRRKPEVKTKFMGQMRKMHNACCFPSFQRVRSEWLLRED